MSWRTETAYKAQSPGKLAQHNEAPDSGDRVNAAAAQWKFTFLSGEICPTCGLLTALCMATCKVIGQKSAAVIVGVGRHQPVVWWLETSPDEGRTHPTEGPNAMKDVSFHKLLSAMNLKRGAIKGRVVELTDFWGLSAVTTFQRAVGCAFIRLRPDFLREPPSADPHDRWCGGRGRESSGYPISTEVTMRYIFFYSPPGSKIAEIIGTFIGETSDEAQKKLPI